MIQQTHLRLRDIAEVAKPISAKKLVRAGEKMVFRITHYDVSENGDVTGATGRFDLAKAADPNRKFVRVQWRDILFPQYFPYIDRYHVGMVVTEPLDEWFVDYGRFFVIRIDLDSSPLKLSELFEYLGSDEVHDWIKPRVAIGARDIFPIGRKIIEELPIQPLSCAHP